MLVRFVSVKIFLVSTLSFAAPVIPELRCDPLCGGRAGCGSDRFTAIESVKGRVRIEIEFDRTEGIRQTFKVPDPFRTIQYEVPTTDCLQGQGNDISALIASCSASAKVAPSVKFIDYEGKVIAERALWVKLETKFVTSVSITKSGPRPDLAVTADVAINDGNSRATALASFVPEHCQAKSLFGAR